MNENVKKPIVTIEMEDGGIIKLGYSILSN